MPMPSLPISIMTDKEIAPLLTGKTVLSAGSEQIYTGKYDWHQGAFDLLPKLNGAAVAYADSHCILFDNTLRIEYGYFPGDLRYSDEFAGFSFPNLKEPVTHAHVVTLVFTDNSALAVRLYSWSTHFRISGSTDKAKSAVFDGADPSDFTFERFYSWCRERGNMNIVENCSTAKGALDLYNPVMCWVLLQAGIHPRAKTRTLSDDAILALYNEISALMADYRSGRRICEHINLFGNVVTAENDIVWMNASTKGKPCPLCGGLIDATPCAGTKMYFCPNCQQIKKS